MSTGGGIFVDAEEKCCRLSTLRVPSVEVQCWEQPSGCPEATFVHRRGHFCERGGKMLPPVHTGGAFCGSLVPEGGFCPRRRCFLWKFGARRWLLSTLRVPSVEVQCQEQPSGCPEVTFVHKKGPFRGGMGLQVFVWKGEIVGKRIFLLPLFANHNIQNHFVCGLHPFCANAAEVADCLFYAIFYDTVI